MKAPITEMDGFKVGQWFSVPWSPNPHRLEEIRPQHCQLHGDFIGYQLALRKRRNSEVRLWGSLHIVDIGDKRIVPAAPPAQDQGDKQ